MVAGSQVGSSSGGAVSISDGMAPATIGSDTGGSTRTPAAFCGIVGLKPTSTRMPGDGVYPLSTSFDAAGPMSNSVDCAAIMDSIMAGGDGAAETPFPLAGLRLGMPVGYLFDGLDDAVATSFDEAVQRLSAAGATISKISLDILEELRPANNPKSIVAAEAFALHRDRLQSNAHREYDPFVASRIKSGSDILAADYIDQFAIRRQTMRLVQQQTRVFDALNANVPAHSPEDRGAFHHRRKTENERHGSAQYGAGEFSRQANNHDSMPQTRRCPSRLSLMGSHKHDRRLLAIAAGAEATIRG